MNIFYEEHRSVLKTLLQHSVNFILIGGYAVNYYGYNRVTGDMDIWLMPTNENKVKLIAALSDLGFDKEGLSVILSWDFTKAQKFNIGNDKQPDKSEFLTNISGVKYEDADKNKIIAEIEDLKLPIIHINNLLQNKKSTSRLKDAVDAEYLEKIMKLRNIKND